MSTYWRGGIAAAQGLLRSVLSVVRRIAVAWGSLRPAQQLVAGFAVYCVLGAAALWLPAARTGELGTWRGVLDHVFTAVSAVSTTGLTTVAVGDAYTRAGQVVILLLFQVGAIGFMTMSSVLILARGRQLSAGRVDVLRAGFALPHYFKVQHFVVQALVFTVVCEAVGAVLLWWRFSALGIEDPMWSAVFHSVSAFATAGFSTNAASLEAFRGDWAVNLIIGVLSYQGAIGFIVAQDVWYSIKLRERMVTFTSKVILWMTAAVFVLGTLLVVVLEPAVRGMPWGERVLVSAFQVMSASTTAGFNTIPIGSMATPAIIVLVVAMLIGASPSGTGGGIKTTSVSAILGNLLSVVRGRRAVSWMGYEVPMPRVLLAFATATLYLMLTAAGVLALSISERAGFLAVVFEVVSAICTVGLSMGITAELSPVGKLVVIALMFVGRCGPLTIGLALLRPGEAERLRPDDLAV